MYWVHGYYLHQPIYCASVWINSAHTNKLDTQLNSAMRIIGRTLKTTPLNWLPVLSIIAPPEIRREQSLIREWTKINNNKSLLIYADVRLNVDKLRLKSRKPPWKTAEILLLENIRGNTKWLEDWMAENPYGQNIVTDSTSKQPGFDLPRQILVTLNRIRTGYGRCNHKMFKWKLHTTPSCDCRNDKQTIYHIATEYPTIHSKALQMISIQLMRI
jgi:hypothetical protein